MVGKIGTMFESGVNPEGIQTVSEKYNAIQKFESGVNPEGIQTITTIYITTS